MKKNETRVVCPKCGTEFEIPEHSHVATGIVIGKDSGLGTVVLKEAGSTATKAKERIEALRAAGVDVSGLFAMQTGEIARNEGGILSVVPDNDPIYSAILNGGTIPDRRLFRRWVMAQMFHLLTAGYGNFTENLRAKGVKYQWDVIEDELKTQNKLFNNDRENYGERNRWFNKDIVADICNAYLKDLRKYVSKLKEKKCKGVPYVTISGRGDVFVADLETKVFRPIENAARLIANSKAPSNLYLNYLKFKKVCVLVKSMKMDSLFIDVYKGVGAYYTMKNLVLFHSCVFSDPYTGKKMTQKKSMDYLRSKASEYSVNYAEGWRLFGVMKKLLEDNSIDIKAKMASWRKK